MVNYAELKVTQMGGTEGYIDHIEEIMEDNETASDAEVLMEFGGRGCYLSWDKPNPKTANTPDYLKNIIAQGHESVLEHASVSFYIEGVSRALTHELVRHRHFSYSQLSQRFVDEAAAAMVLPPAIDKNSRAAALLEEVFEKSLQEYEQIVDALTRSGLKRKQAREAARAVLPNMTETKILVTGNHRAWRQFLQRRMDPAADAEIRRLAYEIFEQLYVSYPALYEDIKEMFNV